MAKQLSPAHRGFKMTYVTCQQAEEISKLVRKLQSGTPYKVTRGAVLSLALEALAAKVSTK